MLSYIPPTIYFHTSCLCCININGFSKYVYANCHGGLEIRCVQVNSWNIDIMAVDKRGATHWLKTAYPPPAHIDFGPLKQQSVKVRPHLALGSRHTVWTLEHYTKTNLWLIKRMNKSILVKSSVVLYIITIKKITLICPKSNCMGAVDSLPWLDAWLGHTHRF